MKKARNIKELNELLADKFTKDIKQNFKDGKIKKYCPVCKREQILKLDGIKAKCIICDKDFNIDIECRV